MLPLQHAHAAQLTSAAGPQLVRTSRAIQPSPFFFSRKKDEYVACWHTRQAGACHALPVAQQYWQRQQGVQEQHKQCRCLLSISGTEVGELRQPEDFEAMVLAAIRSSELKSDAASQAGSGWLDQQGEYLEGVPHLLVTLHEAEKALSSVMRPARYCQDFHPDPAWRAAAAGAYTTAAAAQAGLHSRTDLQQLLQRCEQRLWRAAVAANKGGLADSTQLMGDQGAGSGADLGGGAAAAQLEPGEAHTKAAARAYIGMDLGQGGGGGWTPWLRVCRTLLSAWDRSSAGGATLAGRLAMARQHERQCAAALRQLLKDRHAAPRLIVHPEQAWLLEAWTGSQLRDRGQARASQPLQPQQPQQQEQQQHPQRHQLDTPAVESSGDRDSGGGSGQGIVVGPEGRRQLLLFGDVWLDLTELDTVTDEVAELQQQQQQQQQQLGSSARAQQHALVEPVTLVMPASLSEVLLRHHPSEGVRWQVYRSCLVPQARVALAALTHLAHLRNEVAALQGLASHTHATLDGSILGTPEASASFTRDFARALHDYAASDLRDLCRMARRAGLDARTPPPASALDSSSSSSSSKREGGWAGTPAGAMPLDPWNVDFLIARAAELQAAPKSPRSAGSGWRQYQDYFSVGSVLQGIHKLLQCSLGLGLVPDPQALSSQDAALVGTWRQQQQQQAPQMQQQALQAVEAEGGTQSLRGAASSTGKGSSSSSSSSNSSKAISSEASSSGSAGSSGSGASSGAGSGEHVTHAAAAGCVLNEGGVLVRLLVQHEERAAPDPDHGVGVVYLHLHTHGRDYPFTTLLQHSVQGPAPSPPVVLIRLPLPTLPTTDLKADGSSSSSSSAAAAAATGVEAAAEAAAGGDSSTSVLPAAWQLPLRVEQPFFLRALCHELGHALHYVLSELQPMCRGGADSSSSSSSSSSAGALPPPLPGSLRSAQYCPVDWREAGPHVLERWATDPAALRAMSRHARLHVPLPPRDATRCAALLSTLSQASVIELTELAVGALGDQLLHMQLPRAGVRPDGPAAGGAVARRGRGQAPAPCSRQQQKQQQQQQQQQQRVVDDGVLSGSGGWTARRSARLQLHARAALRRARFEGLTVLGGAVLTPTHPSHPLLRTPQPQPRLQQQPQTLRKQQDDAQPQRPQQQQGGVQGHLLQQQQGEQPRLYLERQQDHHHHHHQQQQQQVPARAGRVVVAPAPDEVPDCVEPLSVSLDTLALADAQAVVGGAQVAYLLAKLLAAAVWRIHFRQGCLCPEGGRAVRSLLLEAGAHTCSPQQMVAQLLGDPHALQQMLPQQGAQTQPLAAVVGTKDPAPQVRGVGTNDLDQQEELLQLLYDPCAVAAGGEGEGEGEDAPQLTHAGAHPGSMGRAAHLGWVPDLSRDVWQDVDLLR